MLDPFAGSYVTGYACEGLKRKWLGVDLDRDYVWASMFRFEGQVSEQTVPTPRQKTKVIEKSA